MTPRELPARPATKVYVSDAGYVCIQQDVDDGQTTDQTIILEAGDAQRVARWIVECCEEAATLSKKTGE